MMDMEWSFRFVLLGILTAGFIGMIVCRRRPVMAGVILPLIAWGGMRRMAELHHLYRGEMIRAQAGITLGYIFLLYFTMAVSAVLLLIGALQGWRRRTTNIGSR